MKTLLLSSSPLQSNDSNHSCNTSNNNNSIYLTQHKKPKKVFDFAEVALYFSVPLCEASERLNVSVTHLKRNCRRLGIKKWPYKKLRRVKRRIADIEAQIRSVQSESELEALKKRKEQWEDEKLRTMQEALEKRSDNNQQLQVVQELHQNNNTNNYNNNNNQKDSILNYSRNNNNNIEKDYEFDNNWEIKKNLQYAASSPNDGSQFSSLSTNSIPTTTKTINEPSDNDSSQCSRKLEKKMSINAILTSENDEYNSIVFSDLSDYYSSLFEKANLNSQIPRCKASSPFETQHEQMMEKQQQQQRSSSSSKSIPIDYNRVSNNNDNNNNNNIESSSCKTLPYLPPPQNITTTNHYTSLRFPFNTWKSDQNLTRKPETTTTTISSNSITSYSTPVSQDYNTFSPQLPAQQQQQQQQQYRQNRESRRNTLLPSINNQFNTRQLVSSPIQSSIIPPRPYSQQGTVRSNTNSIAPVPAGS